MRGENFKRVNFFMQRVECIWNELPQEVAVIGKITTEKILEQDHG